MTEVSAHHSERRLYSQYSGNTGVYLGNVIYDSSYDCLMFADDKHDLQLTTTNAGLLEEKCLLATVLKSGTVVDRQCSKCLT